MQKYFITGTDTDVGKTLITRILLTKVKQQGLKALAIKPLAAGGVTTMQGFQNEDATFFQQESSLQLPYTVINPYLLQDALSPNIGAQRYDRILDAKEISQTSAKAYHYPVDYLFIEGAGGWQVPINATQTMADVAQALNIPIIMVVGMRLGCLNHALLTAAQIRSQNLVLAGFIANQITPTPQTAYEENIATLITHLKVPLLGKVPYSINNNIAALTRYIDLSPTHT